MGLKQQDDSIDFMVLDERRLSRPTIMAVRIAYGAGGAAALVLGLIIALWPEKTLVVLAVAVGVYFLAVGAVRIVMGLFTTGMSGGLRVLNIIFGVLLIVAGILAIRNSSTTAAALATFVVALIGIGWIIEGVVALAEYDRTRRGGWTIAYGVVGILAGVLVLVVPLWTAIWLMVFAGCVLIVLGLVNIVRAIRFGRSPAA